jgi:hypothetical protein
LNKRQVLDVDDADRSSFLMLIEPPPQKKAKTGKRRTLESE